jgi:formate hydrogenlyase subunit 6/NADH:ubiquinone oxidoreductase subunit I
MQHETQSYWKNISETVSSLSKGLSITFKHLLNARKSKKTLPVYHQDYFLQPDGISTIQYPHETLPVPDNGRYRLHNEIDDCIVCDKCAKICPVNCITIEPIKAVEEIGKTSDGTSKRIYAAKFDIDMAKCCFCGLCTTVCPTECLTMTKVYDFSVTDIHEHNFAFAEMSEAEIAEKKKVLEEHQRAKTAPTPVTPVTKSEGSTSLASPQITQPEAPKPATPKPVFRPKMKPPGPPSV